MWHLPKKFDPHWLESAGEVVAYMFIIGTALVFLFLWGVIFASI